MPDPDPMEVEKITALGGDPTTKVGELVWDPDPAKTLDHLIETEEEVTAALHAVDWLRRARRTP